MKRFILQALALALPVLALVLALVLGVPRPALADFNDGVVAYSQGDYKRAFISMQALAEGSDHVLAMYYLGIMYLKGQGVEPELVQAARWLRAAAEQAVPQAQFQLGRMYLEGKGLPRDPEQAYAWYRTGAELGHSDSLQAVGQAEAELAKDELSEAQNLAAEYIEKYGPAAAERRKQREEQQPPPAFQPGQSP